MFVASERRSHVVLHDLSLGLQEKNLGLPLEGGGEQVHWHWFENNGLETYDSSSVSCALFSEV